MYPVRVATPADAESISQLVNRAYRPDVDDCGWTSEAGLVAGERISPAQVGELLGADSQVLVMTAAEKIIGCVHIERAGDAAYIGMLATEPHLQAQGLGKLLLAAAEYKAIELFQPALFKMSVISKRPALLAFYQRRGYQLSGETAPYPLEAGVGQPLVDDMQLLQLTKRVV